MNPVWWREGEGCPPLFKWTGGKRSELPEIRDAAPRHRPLRVIEPFFGGGAVGLSIPTAIPLLASDASTDLVDLYRALSRGCPDLRAVVSGIDRLLDAVQEGARRPIDESASHLARLIPHPRFPTVLRARLREGMERRGAWSRARDLSRAETAAQRATGAMGGAYTALRDAFVASSPGTPGRAALFWYLREFAFNGMHRFNASGGFNAPYGGRTYDARRMGRRLAQWDGAMPRLANAEFRLCDFADTLGDAAPGDFVMLDPPYDSPFSTYDGNAFGRDDHRRLARILADLPADWMIVIAETDFVRDTYTTIPGVTITRFDKRYRGSIKGRHDGAAVHLVVTNYERNESSPGVSAPLTTGDPGRICETELAG